MEGLRLARGPADGQFIDLWGGAEAEDEIDGTLAGDGRRLEKSYAAIRPLDWVRRICGAVGEAHACPNGVVAPTLLIDGSG